MSDSDTIFDPAAGWPFPRKEGDTMDTQTETTKGTGRRGARGARGRQDRSGQEKVIRMKELTDRIPHLVSLHNKAKEASTDLSSAVKSIAEKSGLLASVVRRLIVAKAGDNFDEKKKEAEQLSLAFDEIA